MNVTAGTVDEAKFKCGYVHSDNFVGIPRPSAFDDLTFVSKKLEEIEGEKRNVQREKKNSKLYIIFLKSELFQVVNISHILPSKG